MPPRAPDAPPDEAPVAPAALAVLPKFLLTTDQACYALGIKSSKLRMLTADGEIEARELGGLTMYLTTECERYANSLPVRKPKALSGAAAKAVAAKAGRRP